MATYKSPSEIHDIIKRFANTPVEEILHKPYVKLALNKLRFIPISMSITHLLLPEMPIGDLIQMGIYMTEQITTGNELDETSYYRILAARNIVLLLLKAYDFNPNVRDYFDLTIKQVLEPVKEHPYVQNDNYVNTLKKFSLNENDSIYRLAESILTHIEPITEMSGRKREVSMFRDRRSDNEPDTILAFELYHLFFSKYFATEFPEAFSEESLNAKYHTNQFIDDYHREFIIVISGNQEGCDDDED